MSSPLSPGPIMLDMQAPALRAEERELLSHPLAGGVILFARNYSELAQLRALTAQLRALRQPPLLIAVDHEGGRVQRFQQGFTRLPPAAAFGALYDEDSRRALDLCEQTGWLLADELLAAGVDFSFAPVLDLNYDASTVIGDRAFHRDADVVSSLASRLMQGMRAAGMAAVGKHFPGHGFVAADSHHAVAVDQRPYADILKQDLLPFAHLIDRGLAAIMPAHVIYPDVDDKPAGFSRAWLQDVLRKRLGFQGAIFSDDLTMAAAEAAGGYLERVQAALAAGCDMVLICNNRAAAAEALDWLDHDMDPTSQLRLARLHGRPPAGERDYARLAAVRAQLAALDDVGRL